ncbi:uncharacterized protein METZ01_LOCUS163811, partial [marine metagenome]
MTPSLIILTTLILYDGVFSGQLHTQIQTILHPCCPFNEPGTIGHIAHQYEDGFSMSTAPTHIQEMLTGFWVSKALFTGVELGLFDELAKGPASAEVLAYRLRLHPGALERLMNALVALELITKEDGRF